MNGHFNLITSDYKLAWKAIGNKQSRAKEVDFKEIKWNKFLVQVFFKDSANSSLGQQKFGKKKKNTEYWDASGDLYMVEK